MQLKQPAGTHIQNLLITSVKISDIGNEYRGGGGSLFPVTDCITALMLAAYVHVSKTNVDV